MEEEEEGLQRWSVWSVLNLWYKYMKHEASVVRLLLLLLLLLLLPLLLLLCCCFLLIIMINKEKNFE